MIVSFFETAHYRPPRKLPAEWPVPPDAYDRAAGVQSYRGMVERVQYAEKLGFDWVSVAEHHYSPHRLTPAPIVSAAHLADQMLVPADEVVPVDPEEQEVLAAADEHAELWPAFCRRIVRTLS